MNTTLNEVEETKEETKEETTKAELLPFPSHVKSPAPNSQVHPLAPELLATSQDMNNVLASAGNVHMFVRTHFVSMERGIYGIESLIADILRQNVLAMGLNETGTFPRGIENAEYRATAISGAMFASEVIEKVREQFGADRYPDSVIASYLAHHMRKAKSKNQVQAIRLSNMEDKTRPQGVCKPRSKYYLVDTTPDDAILLADAKALTMPS